MSIKSLVVAATLFLSACTVESPSPELMERVEQKAAQHPCLGTPRRWHRIYFFRPGWFGDTRRVYFEYIEADPEETDQEVRREAFPDDPITVSGTLGFRAQGSYEIGSDELLVENCGPNYP